MISREVALLLIGAAIGLVSALIGALIQHYLSLRVDRVEREKDKVEKQRAILSEGASDRAPGFPFAPFLSKDSKRLVAYQIYRSFKELVAGEEAENQEGEQDEPAE